MRQRFLNLSRAVLLFALNGLFALFRIFVEGWRWWVGLAVAGALLLAGVALLQPRDYRSEGSIAITPRFLLEGYLLATEELTRHYAARLGSDTRVARAMAAAGTTVKPRVTAEGRAGMIIALTVEHSDAAAAEAFTRALMADLRAEILAENRTRIESDRLNVELSLTSFARPTAPPAGEYALYGALAGFGAGALWTYALAWWGRGRLRTDAEARRALGLPTLGMIPRR